MQKKLQKVTLHDIFAVTDHYTKTASLHRLKTISTFNINSATEVR